MGKASKWFRALLGLDNSHKKKWTLTKSHKEKDRYNPDDNDASKHAIAVAVATAAAAEAAVAAAQAAAAVVQLTSSGRNIRSSCGVKQSSQIYRREEWAAVTIQSHFRGYLSRRALRALKALVKLQALVRGHLVRKQTAYALRRLQVLVRAQVRAREGRALNYEPSTLKASHFNYPEAATTEKLENASRARSVKGEHFMMLKRSSSKTSSGSVDHIPEKSQARRTLIDNRTSGRLSQQAYFPPDDDKILEVDTETSKHRRPLFYSSHLSLNSDQVPDSPSSCEVQSMSPLKFAEHENESLYNSPTYYSVSSKDGGRRSFTPSKSDGSRSCLSGYSDHPNYMAYTKSSKAKTRRSLSAPKQRPNLEKSRYGKRCSVYPGSGRLDREGMPVGYSGPC